MQANSILGQGQANRPALLLMASEMLACTDCLKADPKLRVKISASERATPAVVGSPQ
ncbi:hypothetical protein D3C80_1725650 [compost metagenome]